MADVIPYKATEMAKLTLDDLWREAELLGVVEVDHCIGSREYRVEITFYRGGDFCTGTRVVARGVDVKIHRAMAAAVMEAKELK